jgi:recombination protein RecA
MAMKKLTQSGVNSSLSELRSIADELAPLTGGLVGVAKEVIPTERNVIPFGDVNLDHNIMTIGGLPLGRVVEISGPEAGGKSTLALKAVAQAQKRGHICMLVDVEASYGDAFGRQWMETLGVDTNNLIYVHELVAERVGAICLRAMDLGVRVIVIDSIAFLKAEADTVTHYAELEGEKFIAQYAKAQVAPLARVLSTKLSEIKSKAFVTGTLVICINQLRDKPGLLYGDVETTPGGHALKHTADVRLRVKKEAYIKEGKLTIGNEASVVLQKCKVSPPGKKTGVDTPGYLSIYYDGREPDQLDAYIPLAERLGLITRPPSSGSRQSNTMIYISAGGTEVRKTGREAMKAALKETGLADELAERCRKANTGQFAAAALPDSESDDDTSNDDYKMGGYVLLED